MKFNKIVKEEPIVKGFKCKETWNGDVWEEDVEEIYDDEWTLTHLYDDVYFLQHERGEEKGWLVKGEIIE